MVQGVYVDILLCTNFIVHFLLLSLLGMFCPVGSRRRMVLAAAVGSLFSLSIFLPPLPFWCNAAMKLGSTLGVVVLACPRADVRGILKSWLLLFCLSSLLFGILSAMQQLYTLSGMYVFDNAVYFHIRVPVFIICLAAAYAVVWTANRFLLAQSPTDSLFEVHLRVDGQETSLIGLMDTGNSLTEPFSGAPVVVCGLDTAVRWLPVQTLEEVQIGQSVRLRQIPFSAVSGNGLLPALRGEWLELHQGERCWRCEQFYLAISTKSIGDGDWQLLLNRQLLRAGSEMERTGVGR